MKNKESFVRTNEHKRQGETFSLAQSFSCAWQGIRATFVHERNIRIQACLGLLAVALCFVLPVESWAFPVAIICIGVVMGFECANTALEALVDLVSPQYHPLAKLAKDAAAGAALIGAIMSVVVAGFIFIPAVLKCFGI